MEKGHISAFKKIERELEEKKKAEQRRVAAELERERILRFESELKKKKRRQSVLIYCSLCLFLVVLVYGIHKSKVQARSQGKTVAAWAGGEIKNMVNAVIEEEIDCSKPDNWRLEYCTEKRKQATDQEWKNISFNKKDGKDAAFSVSKPSR